MLMVRQLAYHLVLPAMHQDSGEFIFIKIATARRTR